MCDPITAVAVTSTALSIGGTVTQAQAQKKAVKETKRANAQMQADTTNAANADYQTQLSGLRLRGQQETAQAADLISTNTTTARRSVLASTRQAAMADAQARVSAGAAGVSGASVDALLADITRVEGTNTAIINQDLTKANANIRENLRMADQQRQTEAQAFESQRQSRINGVANLPVPQTPNPFAVGLQIGKDVLGFASFLTTRKPSK